MRRVLDAGCAALLRLPPGGAYTRRAVTVPMRDGVLLRADHYAPARPAVGTLLVRCPYGRSFPFSLVFARLYAARGYHVVLQSVRGTFGSGGEFVPAVNEAADGADTVAWLRTQPWFTGSFGTVGLSYLGFTQWALLADPPPELKAAVIAVGPHDFSRSSWGTGAFTLTDFLGWSHMMAHQEDRPRIRAGIHQLGAPRTVARVAARLPLGTAGRELLGPRSPWYESWIAHPDPADAFWEPFRHPAALERVEMPVLLLGGWQDLFLDQTLAQYRRLRDRGVDVALTVGPWTHTQMLTDGLGVVMRDSLGWLDHHLAGGAERPRGTRVRVYRTGATGAGWQQLADWPPPTTEQSWYLHPDGGLAPAPAPEAAPMSFRYDPADPTPTVGGRLLAPGGGYRRDGALARRRDVVTFTSDPLLDDVDVSGNPVVELAHSSDNPHVDVFVRVSEVDARGRSRNVSDGYRRITNSPRMIRLELDPVAHRFTVGSRIRLLIAGGCLPRFARNTGTGEPPVSGTELRPATHTVTFGESRLLLPVGAVIPEDRNAPTARTARASRRGRRAPR